MNYLKWQAYKDRAMSKDLERIKERLEDGAKTVGEAVNGVALKKSLAEKLEAIASGKTVTK